jgi:GAF domain-containing protein
LEAAAQVAREAAAIRDVGRLLSETVRLVSDHFGFYHAGIFLLDEAREYAMLRAASSEGGQRMLAREHRLKVGEVGIVGYAAGTGEPRIALDVGADAVFFDNPDLPDTRSEMGLPLKVRGRVIGVLDVQSVEEGAFSDDDVAILQTMADQLALAIENAHLLEESQYALRELEALYGQRTREAWREQAARQANAYRYTGMGVESVSSPSALEMEDLPLRSRSAVVQGEDGRQLIAPVRLRGQSLGSIILRRDPEGEPWSPDEIALVEQVSAQIGLALENARLLEETRQRAEQERLLGDITARVRASMDLESILQTAVRELGAALGTDKAFIRLGAGVRSNDK